MKKAIIAVSLLLLAVSSRATNYYVDNTAGGTNSGTLANPWTSLASVSWGSITSDDSLLLKRGDTFSEAFTTGASGTSGHPIIIGAYGSGAAPIISGLETASSWSSIGGNMYECTLSGGRTTLKMVTRDGVFQAIGRYPKLTDANSGYVAFQSHSGTTSITSNAISGFSSFVGGEVVIRTAHWLLNRGKVDAQTSTLVTYSALSSPYGIYEPGDGNGFFFQNNANACSQLGEWWYDSTAKKIKMYSASGMGGITVKCSVIDTLVKLTSKSYVTFSGITFTGANLKTFLLSGSDHITVDNCTISYQGENVFGFNGTCSNLTVNNCSISYVNNNVLGESTVTYTTISNNNIDHIGSIAGMGVSGDGQYFAVSAQSANDYVGYNRITNCGYIPIVFNGTNTKVEYNFIDTFCNVKDDGGGIYTGTNTNTGKVVQYNIVLEGIGAPDGTSDGTPSAMGIYVDDNSANITISNNTIEGCTGFGFEFHNSHELTITNNTLYNNGNDATGAAVMFAHESGNNPIRNITMTGNKFISKTSNQSLLLFYTDESDTRSAFTTTDYNYYARPIHQTDGIYIDETSSWVTFEGWQSFIGQESHSGKTPKAVSSTDSLRFEYNASASAVLRSIGNTYEDMIPISYLGYVTIPAYGSAALIYTGSFTPATALRLRKGNIKLIQQ